MKQILCGLLILSTLNACGGGGGGGGGFVGAALASINASPTNIDPGDRTQVTVQIAEVHENGIALKIRFPEALEFVTGSSLLSVDGDDTDDVRPRVNSVKDGKVYLVYYLSQSRFGENHQGTLRLQLQGVSEASDGKIEVDADIDDPNIPNSSEFSLDNPEFGAEDEVGVQVKN